MNIIVKIIDSLSLLSCSACTYLSKRPWCMFSSMTVRFVFRSRPKFCTYGQAKTASDQPNQKPNLDPFSCQKLLGLVVGAECSAVSQAQTLRWRHDLRVQTHRPSFDPVWVAVHISIRITSRVESDGKHAAGRARLQKNAAVGISMAITHHSNQVVGNRATQRPRRGLNCGCDTRKRYRWKCSKDPYMAGSFCMLLCSPSKPNRLVYGFLDCAL